MREQLGLVAAARAVCGRLCERVRVVARMRGLFHTITPRRALISRSSAGGPSALFTFGLGEKTAEWSQLELIKIQIENELSHRLEPCSPSGSTYWSYIVYFIRKQMQMK